MKLAIPTKGNNVDEHFGNCEYYTIVTIDQNGQIEKMENFDSPKGCGCKSDIANTFASMGIKTMLAGNMGQGAVNKITMAGINVVRGCSGDVKKLVESYLDETVMDSGETCNHHGGDHEHGHQCNH